MNDGGYALGGGGSGAVLTEGGISLNFAANGLAATFGRAADVGCELAVLEQCPAEPQLEGAHGMSQCPPS